MARVIVGMTTWLDGVVADANGSAIRLYPDLAALPGTAYMNEAIEETGAVLMGKRTFEMWDPGSYVGSNGDLEHVRLEKIGVREVGARTSLRFRVAR
jgi:hypothetical protein